MNVQVLLDGIVRQTTVLIAQVATNAGGRAPVAQVANQVFLDLTQALQEQGVGRKVIADMFGMALRSYQQKVQRLTESVTDSDMTLWEAIHRYIAERQIVTRVELMKRFARDNADSVAGVLRDMVESGLAYRTGRADAVVYRIAAREDLERVLSTDPQRTAEALVWVAVYQQQGPITRGRLRDWVRLEESAIEAALAALQRDGRVRAIAGAPEPSYTSDKILIQLGETVGWEAALLDHYRAVVAAICAKLRDGRTRALPADQQGGSTFSFDVWPGHPKETQVLALLASTRSQLQQLWKEVTEHNALGKPDAFKRVTFYLGQMVAQDSSDEAPDESVSEGNPSHEDEV
jgi:hypothetical protein